MTIYVVTSGEYSSFGIEAMFTTMEKAERYKSDLEKCGGENVSIVEYTPDEGDAFILAVQYFAAIDLLSGEITRRKPRAGMQDTRESASNGKVPEVYKLNDQRFGWYCLDQAYATSWISQEDADAKARQLKAEFERTVLSKYRIKGRQSGPYLNVELIG